MSAYFLVITTVAEQVDAKKLAELALENGLAGCVQVQAACTSYYEWQGKAETSTEYPVHFKTNQLKKDQLMKWIKDNHPYELPEIMAIKVTDLEPAYAKWLDEQINSK